MRPFGRTRHERCRLRLAPAPVGIRRGPARDDETGSVSILTLAVVTVVFLLSLGLVDAVTIAHARVRATTAADAAALAGASALDGTAPTKEAVTLAVRRYAHVNGAELADLPQVDVSASAVTVSVAIEARLRLLPVSRVHARSRAQLVDVPPVVPGAPGDG